MYCCAVCIVLSANDGSVSVSSGKLQQKNLRHLKKNQSRKEKKSWTKRTLSESLFTIGPHTAS